MRNRVKSYCVLMEEVKKRLSVVGAFLDGRCSALYAGTTTESMILQLRMILESIALGSLVANQPEYSRQCAKFATHWHAARILDDLAKVNPDFYPVPTIELQGTEDKSLRLDDIQVGYLTKDEFVDMYGQCSEYGAPTPFYLKMP